MELLNAELIASSESLRKGEKRDRKFHLHGWTFRTVKAPISSKSEFYALNRELQLYQAQKVPEATFVNNSVEIQHDATGVVFSFCALEALRAWCCLGNPPLKLPSGKSVDWDWTFTTPYTGCVTVAPLGTAAPVKPDSSSIFPRAELNLACGQAKLRNPLCNCRGTPRPVLSMPPPEVSKSDSTCMQQSPWLLPSSSRPAWQRLDDVDIDWQGLLRSEQPLFVDQVDLFQDDMHDFGLSHLFVRIWVASTFWLVTLRYFLRVESICSKVIESRFLCRFREGSSDDVVLRQCSWKEGDWASLVGISKSISIDQLNDSVAAQRLPDKQPTTYDQMVLSSTGLKTVDMDAPVTCWERAAYFRGASCAAGDIAVIADGSSLEVISVETGEVRWRAQTEDDADVLALALTIDSKRLAVGDDTGIAHIWTTDVGEVLLRLEIACAGAVNTNRWLERAAWSSDGQSLAFCAGRTVAIVSETGEVECRHEEQSSIANMTFMPDGALAVATYGGVRVLSPQVSRSGKGDAVSGNVQTDTASILLERSAASVQCVAASPDGKQVAAGCLDKTMRVFTLDATSPVDWVGFNGPIVAVAWNVTGSMLAACAGNAVLVTNSCAMRGEPPILCRGPGVPEAEGSLGSCPHLCCHVPNI